MLPSRSTREERADPTKRQDPSARISWLLQLQCSRTGIANRAAEPVTYRRRLQFIAWTALIVALTAGACSFDAALTGAINDATFDHTWPSASTHEGDDLACDHTTQHADPLCNDPPIRSICVSLAPEADSQCFGGL